MIPVRKLEAKVAKNEAVKFSYKGVTNANFNISQLHRKTTLLHSMG